jgi:hypothetical protein
MISVVGFNLLCATIIMQTKIFLPHFLCSDNWVGLFLEFFLEITFAPQAYQI